jgi:large subunit ribosomal protein L15
LQPTDPEKSGLYMVAQQALYAIVGAIALERGGLMANKFVKDKILSERLDSLS